MKYIKLFNRPEDGHMFNINDIPFVTAVSGTNQTPIYCKKHLPESFQESRNYFLKNINNELYVIPIEVRYTTIATAITEVTPNIVDQGYEEFGANLIDNKWDSTTKEGVFYFDGPVTKIGNDVFKNCKILETIDLPNSITSIGDYAFYWCDALKSIKIPDNVTSIGGWAFNGCKNLISLFLPNSITRIEERTFSGCTKLTYINIPNSVTSIGEYAFGGCGFAHIEIPNSVETIDRDAFMSCKNLVFVEIPNSITIINQAVFSACTNLLHVIIPNSIISIEENAFNECTNLQDLMIPNSVISIKYNSFINCPSLSSIIVDSDNTTYDNRNNCNAIIETTTNTLILGCKNTIIPNNVVKLGTWCFYGSSNLTTIEIPNSVINIGLSAFCRTGLISVIIPNSVTRIEGGAFSFCNDLTSVTIPNSVTSIGVDCFANCINLTSIEIPTSVTTFGQNAFKGCGITYPLFNANTFIYMPPSYRGAYTIQNGIKGIAISAFYDCKKITSIVIPDSVIEIGMVSFQNCSSLSTLIIGSGVTKILESAFHQCTNITSITCKATTPPMIKQGTWGSGSYKVPRSTPLYVPAASVSAYQSAQYWREFTNIQAIPNS